MYDERRRCATTETRGGVEWFGWKRFIKKSSEATPIKKTSEAPPTYSQYAFSP
jgi:hypothetical protein